MTFVRRLTSPKAVYYKAKSMLRNTSDIDAAFWSYQESVKGFTMTSAERLYALYESILYVNRSKIDGAFVECGVYKGGSSLLAALMLSDLGDFRDIWLYDTFAGMTAPTAHDFKPGSDASETRETFQAQQSGTHNEWCFAGLNEVKSCLARANYPADKIRYVVGDVMETIPNEAPDKIAILRLDTDFYDSTKHELEHLYDRLVPGGLLIIDDYGAWQGARKAVDEYFSSIQKAPFLARIDETARTAQKPW